MGDGRSDFTLKTRSYSFQYNHQNFILLDVPGIEGSEQKVIDQISNATQKAHAIFYVTKTPNPPQKGEEWKRGTIEKIQYHLEENLNRFINYPFSKSLSLIQEIRNEAVHEKAQSLHEAEKLRNEILGIEGASLLKGVLIHKEVS
ncbi:hypothetical protein HpHCM70_03350 [Helicobacter pylori]